MTRDPRYDVLFEPVPIGPVTARNRFFQVPHCNGMGWTQPQALAAMRGIKAEGGWAVVSTEEVEIHPSSDCEPSHEGRLWSDADIPALALMTEAVHRHGALAAIELIHQGAAVANYGTREIPLGPSHRPITYYSPVQARAMDLQDIRNLRQWHREAALRAKRAGFDIVYVYAGHDLSVAQHFLQRRRNDRRDEYGGSLANRARLLRELIEDTRDAVGDRCAVAVRLAVDELLGADGLTHEGEGHEVLAMLAELPDLWDVNLSGWVHDSQTSRFAKEGFQEDYIRFVKSVTSRPVVGVGRFTSPDTMVSQIRRGVLDFIGAARPSIADPFLPRKLEEGRVEDIRECIGCNICVSSDYTSTNLRCTQNPTMGEEWRRGWHPERIAASPSATTVLVVGSGPAGLEAALACARRGHEVHLAEARPQLGGRVTLESALPGLAEYARVRDWRVGQLNRMPNVTVYRDSPLTAADMQEFEAGHIVIATGCTWRRDGVGRANGSAIPGFESGGVCTPDDIMAGRIPEGPVVIFDDDHYYMASVCAEKCRAAGHPVLLVTPAATVCAWTANTLESFPIARQLARLGVEMLVYTNVIALAPGRVRLQTELSGARFERDCTSLVTVTGRLPNDALYHEFLKLGRGARDPGESPAHPGISRIGDCFAPGTIQAAVYSGHRFARELGETVAPFRRELPMLAGER